MRIPMQPLPFYLSESDGKPFFEGQHAMPVDGSAKLRAALSDYLAEQHPDFSKKEVLKEGRTGEDQQDRNRLTIYEKHVGHHTKLHGGQDRRQEERRKNKSPILLDTRLMRCRRGTTRDSVISFEI